MFPRLATVAVVGIIIDIIIWSSAMIAFFMVISMTASYLEGKRLSLYEAFNSISGKILILIAASAVVWILVRIGFCALCIGALIAWVLLALVRQGIIVDNLSFGETFSKSYNVAKNNFFDILLILLLFLVIKIILGLVLFFAPSLGDALGYFVDVFSVASLTILYIDRRS